MLASKFLLGTLNGSIIRRTLLLRDEFAVSGKFRINPNKKYKSSNAKIASMVSKRQKSEMGIDRFEA